MSLEESCFFSVCVGRLVRAPRFEPLMCVETSVPCSLLARYDTSIHHRPRWARDFATTYSADAIILIGGGAGALIETCAGYLKGKPIIAIEGSGGIADQTKGTFLDERKSVKILSERDPEKAVVRALGLARQRTRSERTFTPVPSRT